VGVKECVGRGGCTSQCPRRSMKGKGNVASCAVHTCACTHTHTQGFTCPTSPHPTHTPSAPPALGSIHSPVQTGNFHKWLNTQQQRKRMRLLKKDEMKKEEEAGDHTPADVFPGRHELCVQGRARACVPTARASELPSPEPPQLVPACGAGCRPSLSLACSPNPPLRPPLTVPLSPEMGPVCGTPREPCPTEGPTRN